jgi:anti-anti-sigma factor
VLEFPEIIDVANADAAQWAIAQVMSHHPRIVLDLSGAPFVTGTGLDVVVAARRSCLGNGGSLRVVVGTPLSRKVFAISEVDRTVPVYGTLAEALALPETDVAGAASELCGACGEALHVGPPGA